MRRGKSRPPEWLRWRVVLHHESKVLFDSHTPAPNGKTDRRLRRSSELRREELPREDAALVLARFEKFKPKQDLQLKLQALITENLQEWAGRPGCPPRGFQLHHYPTDHPLARTVGNVLKYPIVSLLLSLTGGIHWVRVGTRFTMMMNASPTQNVANQLPAANGLAIVRLTIGAMLVWVFFENLGKGLYTPAGYAGLINDYIKTSHSPASWKAVMGLAASHAAMAAPMQAVTEISLGILLLVGLLTRPAAFVAFLYLGSLWVSEWGTSWIWELLVPVLASLALAVGRAGRAWGVDALLARRWPSSPWW